MRHLFIIVLGVLCLNLTACYRLNIEQGNIVTDKMVAQLKPGMSRQQVMHTLGTPVLDTPFHDDTWYFVYTLQPAHKKMTSRHLTVYFRGNRMTRFTTDVKSPRHHY